MRCINCQSEINVGATICPYCHTNPIMIDSQPYDSLKRINEPSPYDPELTLGVLGAFFLPVVPPVGFSLLGLAGLSWAAKWWKGKKE